MNWGGVKEIEGEMEIRMESGKASFPAHLADDEPDSALAYYWEHKEELEADIQRRGEYVEQLREENGPSPLAARFRSRGLIE